MWVQVRKARERVMGEEFEEKDIDEEHVAMIN